jgi:sugar phosphate isomerase/epimerase
MLGNLEDVESIGQEVFLRAFRFAPTYRYPQKFSTWLFTITRNLAINQSRRRKRSPIRNITELNLEGVELAGFYGKSAQEMHALLDAYKLEALSSHVALQLIEEDMFGVIAYYLAIGCKRISVPYLLDADRPGQPGFARVVQVIHRFARLCREAGITLLYHNHDFEFVKLSGSYALDFLFGAVPEELLKTEIDTCWVRYSGLDPAEYVKKYAGRSPIVHMKDYVSDEPTAPCMPRPASFQFRPVGKGCQDVASLVGASVGAGAEWLVVEQDFPFVSPMEDAKTSIASLRAALEH